MKPGATEKHGATQKHDATQKGGIRMYHKISALPVTGLAAHLAGGLGYLYAGLIAFTVTGALLAVKRMLPRRHTS